MLQSIRDRASGVILWFVVAIIVVPFAFWGINNYFGNAAQPKLATVGSAHITRQQFERAYEREYQRLMQAMGKNFDPSTLNQQAFRRNILAGLIQRALMSQQALREGYQVSNQQVLSYIRDIPAFQVKGNFSYSRYKQLLSQQGMSPQQFEGELREALRVQQLQQGITQSAFVTPQEVDQIYALRHEQRKLQYVVFSPSQLANGIKPDAKAVKAYYEKHKAAFKTPSQVRLRYLELSVPELAKQVKVEPAKLKPLYQQEKGSFTVPEQRKARHILLSVSKGDSAAVKKKLENIRQQIEKGASFAKMAKQYSDDTGTADQGGELGWITKGTMAAPIDKVLFALKVGQVSQPVKTAFGWQLFKLQAVRAAHTKPFDDPSVQKRLSQQYRVQQAQQEFQKLSNQLDKQTFVNPNSLKPAAKALNLPIRTTGWLAKSDDKGIFQYAKVRKAAFSDTVMQQHANSRPIQVGQNHEIVVRLDKLRASKQLPLKAVRDQVEAKLRQSKARAEALARAKALMVKLSKNPSGGFAAAAKGLKVHAPGFIERGDSKLPGALVSAVFDMARPKKAGAATLKRVDLGGGKVAVVLLQAVKAGNPAKAKKQERQQLRASLERLASASELGAYQGGLRKSIKVVVHSGNLPAP